MLMISNMAKRVLGPEEQPKSAMARLAGKVAADEGILSGRTVRMNLRFKYSHGSKLVDSGHTVHQPNPQELEGNPPREETALRCPFRLPLPPPPPPLHHAEMPVLSLHSPVACPMDSRAVSTLHCLLFPLLFALGFGTGELHAMPTFRAISLKRLLEPGAFKLVDKAVDTSSSPPNAKPTKPNPVLESKLERCNSVPAVGRKIQLPRLRPSLYATPEVTPLPDSPSSLPSSSPYIINHKRRGPRLLESFSLDSASSHRKVLDEEKSNGNIKDAETCCLASEEDMVVTSKVYQRIADRHVIGADECEVASCKDFKNRVLDAGTGGSRCRIVEENVSATPVALATEIEGSSEFLSSLGFL
ncbi:hypothetical protein NL676_020013 [Syzygium grande]|nr:hypothetical protein NL676_020013 [Syzygium grande]